LTTSVFIRKLNGIRVAKSSNEMEAHMKVFFNAFPDLEISLEEIDIKGNNIFLIWQSTGTNTGVYGEVGATGKKVKINGMSKLYFDEVGQMYREYVYFNELDLLQQLGYSLSFPNLE
jgi:predicted ester cyclase